MRDWGLFLMISGVAIAGLKGWLAPSRSANYVDLFTAALIVLGGVLVIYTPKQRQPISGGGAR